MTDTQKPVAVDFETYYRKASKHVEGYSVSTLGNWRYTRHEEFDAYLLSAHDSQSGQTVVCHPTEFDWSTLTGRTLLSHNAAFDSQVYAALAEQGLVAKMQPANWICTANMTAQLTNRRSLAASSKKVLGFSPDKSARDEASGKHWQDIVREGWADKMKEYAAADVVNCTKLWDELSPRWSAFERRLSDMTIRQCAKGVAINVEALQRARATVKEALFVLAGDLPWVRDEKLPPTSPKAIAAKCIASGIPCPPVQEKDGEAAYIDWVKLHSPRFPWVRGISTWRTLSKVMTSLDTIDARLRPDNTIDFSLLYCGGHTGRWSGGGSGLNLQNLRKDALLFDDGYRLIEDPQTLAAIKAGVGAPHAVVDVRKLFIPRPGNQFIISDLSQIEPRVLAWLNWTHSASGTGTARAAKLMLDQMAAGMSPYEAHARTTMGWTGGELKKEDPGIYKLAKARVLGLGYGCGAAKFGVVAKALADLDLDEETCKKVVADFRATNPGVVDLWNQLNTGFNGTRYNEALKDDGDFVMDLPSGRQMRYENVRQEWADVLRKDEHGNWKTKRVCRHYANIGDQRYALYGALLCENLVQAAARDVFGEHLLALEAKGLPGVWHVHDEAIVEAPIGTDPREVVEVMSVAPDWLPGCPISAEATVADAYLK